MLFKYNKQISNFLFLVVLALAGIIDVAGQEGLPLKAERSIEFTTDEGTWISLDVSGDGKTIVFEDLVCSSANDGDPRLVRSMPIIRKTDDSRIIKGQPCVETRTVSTAFRKYPLGFHFA